MPNETVSPSNPQTSDEGVPDSGVRLIDAEVICSFMEPRPTRRRIGKGARSPGGWWLWLRATEWEPYRITLNECHEVEARLPDEQWIQYATMMMDPAGVRHTKFLLHASAEAKVRALAAALRSRVLPKDEAQRSTGLQGVSK